MSGLTSGALIAAGLGALTLVHPCPFATNLAALSYLLGWRRRGWRIALAFVFGEMAAFAVLGGLVAAGLLQSAPIARFLQVYAPQLLGPLLILAGMTLSGLLFAHQPTLGLSRRFRDRVVDGGAGASFLFGVLIALSFCPMSAAMFFGLLLPLAVANEAVWLYPVLFGLGTGGPLVVLVYLARRGERLMHRRLAGEPDFRSRISVVLGALMVLLGVFKSLRYVFGLV